MLDRNRLKAEIIMAGYTQNKLAEMIGISRQSFYKRMKTGSFGIKEAEEIIKILNIDNPAEIFFAKE